MRHLRSRYAAVLSAILGLGAATGAGAQGTVNALCSTDAGCVQTSNGLTKEPPWRFMPSH